MKKLFIAGSVLAAVTFAGVSAGQASATYGTSEQGVVPTAVPGNFVSFDDQQLCYDIPDLGDLSGYDLIGFKVDPPTDYEDDFIKVTLSPDGKSLAWEVKAGAEDLLMLAFVVKGGPAYNLYNYVQAGLTTVDWDAGLVSPLHKGKTPAISHYNVCYVPPLEVEGDQGCTPGYWRNHADRWLGVASTDDFDDTFTIDLFNPNVTLGWAIWAQGGGNNAFARHATAAILNAYGGVPNGDGTTVAYPYSVDEVIQLVQEAVANGTIEETKDLFATANELGCPLSGTNADPVPV